MTHALATHSQETAQADQALEWLTHSLPSLRSDPQARQDAEMTIAALAEPAPDGWMLARIAALLVPYYDKDTPQGVRMMEAEDWAEALAQYPQWAIENAARWWKGADNVNRRKRPLEGDIQARCRIEMGAITAANIYLSKPIAEVAEVDRNAPRIVDDGMKARADAIVAGLGKGVAA